MTYRHPFPDVPELIRLRLNAGFRWFHCDECGGTFILGSANRHTVINQIDAHADHLAFVHGTKHRSDLE